jgi:signal transduction histidine kinase
MMMPIWSVSLAFFGFCCAGACAISGGLMNREWVLQNNGWLAAGLLFLGGGIAVAASFRSWQMTQRLERLLDAVRRSLGATAGSLGQDLSSAIPFEQQSLLWFADRLDEMVAGIQRLDAQRRDREREVMRSDQLAMVGQLAAGVAHELRNPLTSVKMLVQHGLREGGLRSLAEEDLAIIEHEIRRMERILQQFLDFARPVKPTRRPLSLAAIASRAAALIEVRARKQGVQVVLHEPPAELIVEADEDQLQQLVLNLILNALDLMSEGGTLSIALERPSERECALHVCDTGPGIAPELLHRLFDPFVSTKETGIGLGLAVSHRIALSHGGKLSASNLPGGGARFSLTLPALAAPAEVTTLQH